MDIVSNTVSPLFDPTSEYTTNPHNLRKDIQQRATGKKSLSHTEIASGVACATTALPEVTRGAMRDLVFIPDLAKEVDAVLAHEKCRGDRANRRVAPTLIQTRSRSEKFGSHSELRVAYLVVESAGAIKVVKIRGVGFATPKV